jgi:hypothetical protein
MGQGEVALQRFLNHHNIKATGKFRNCISSMTWKAHNRAVSKVADNILVGLQVKYWVLVVSLLCKVYIVLSKE